MKKFSKSFFFILFAFFIIRCEKRENSKPIKETILEGKITILVDETLKPIIEDQVMIFEDRYNAKIKIEAKSESEVIQSLANNKSGVAIMARNLTKEESTYFNNKKIIPKITPFATDAIALIMSKQNKDTIIALDEIINLVKGQKSTKYKGLVFDNPNSSTVRYMLELSGVKELPQNGVFSFKTNDEVIKYVAENEGMIGVVGLNYIYQPMPNMQKFIDKINVLSIKNTNDKTYYSPTQNNIAENKYPLARELYIINCQGYSGLGMGFASFIAGDIGQRIILKSGLVPYKVPPRKILTRDKITNESK